MRRIVGRKLASSLNDRMQRKIIWYTRTESYYRFGQSVEQKKLYARTAKVRFPRPENSPENHPKETKILATPHSGTVRSTSIKNLFRTLLFLYFHEISRSRSSRDTALSNFSLRMCPLSAIEFGNNRCLAKRDFVYLKH